mmetsp:Transcript_58784/g.187612  ORF Transcript_58784/g.187612 Transcript_58784/m.187612 type:complete len:137 (-) Transcript_58784:1315-1725(-)
MKGDAMSTLTARAAREAEISRPAHVEPVKTLCLIAPLLVAGWSGSLTRFPRYNDVGKLLETKQRSPMASPSSLRGPAGLVEGMTLRQVQVICRHGARTPLTTEYGALEGCVWDDCKTVYKVSFGPPPLCAPSALLP